MKSYGKCSFYIVSASLVFCGNALAETPKEVAVVNTPSVNVANETLDVNLTNETIEVNLANPVVQVEIEEPLDVNVVSIPNVSATVDTSTPLDVQGAVDIGNTPTVFNGDHPALSSFVITRSAGGIPELGEAELVFIDDDTQVCTEGEKTIVTSIQGFLFGAEIAFVGIAPGYHISFKSCSTCSPGMLQFSDSHDSLGFGGSAARRWHFSSQYSGVVLEPGGILGLILPGTGKYANNWGAQFSAFGHCFTS